MNGFQLGIDGRAHRGASLRKRRPSVPAARQAGLTMVELLVAMTISLVIVLAAIASLTVARRGFTSVDAASQLRDNGRLASDLIQRIGVQAGFMNPKFSALPCSSSYADCPPGVDATAVVSPNVTGVDNARPSASDPLNTSTTRSAGSVGYGSDILILRYQTSELLPDSSVADGTMIDCAGNASNVAPTGRNDRMFSVLHVAAGTDGEPSLMCTYQTSAGTFQTQPIIQGVENFQVLYGTDGVTPTAAPTVSPDSVPDRYLRASEMTVTGNTQATAANWRRVRSIRIGMILRGPANSAQDRTALTLYPLGQGKDSSGGSAGSALSSTSDPGTIFTPPSDGRLRQVVTFTIHLRNLQDV